MKILSIDPSIQHLGYAIFLVKRKIPLTYNKSFFKEISAIKVTPDMELLYYGAVKNFSVNKMSWVDKLDYMIKRVLVLSTEVKPNKIVIELPECYQSSRGQAALNSGALTKLFSLVFSLRQALISGNICTINNICLLPVSNWKGQAPKEVTMRRAQERWNYNGTDDNIADAIGIGEYYILSIARTLLYKHIKDI